MSDERLQQLAREYQANAGDQSAFSKYLSEYVRSGRLLIDLADSEHAAIKKAERVLAEFKLQKSEILQWFFAELPTLFC